MMQGTGCKILNPKFKYQMSPNLPICNPLLQNSITPPLQFFNPHSEICNPKSE